MRRDQGLTLVELVITVTIIGFISVAAAALLDSSLSMYTYGLGRTDAHHEAQRIMASLRKEIHTTGHLFYPTGASRTGALMVISGGINQDNDFHGGLSDFPRIDEDTAADMNKDGESGAPALSGLVGGLLGGLGLGGLFSNKNDDDGDGDINEDPSNGMDDDGDGIVDEDWGGDINSDGAAGVRGVDDNMDGLVDNEGPSHDDEDAAVDEDWLEPMVIKWDTATKKITRQIAGSATILTIAENVQGFVVTYEGSTTLFPRLLIQLTLRNVDGSDLVVREYIMPRNMIQREGRRIL